MDSNSCSEQYVAWAGYPRRISPPVHLHSTHINVCCRGALGGFVARIKCHLVILYFTDPMDKPVRERMGHYLRNIDENLVSRLVQGTTVAPVCTIA